MVKYLFFFGVILLVGSNIVNTDSSQNSVDYKITFEQGSSQDLSQQAGEDGYEPTDFGDWLADSAIISKSIDGSGFDKPSESQLMLFVVDQRGSVMSQNSLSLRVTTSSVPLGNRLDSNRLSQSLEALFINRDCSISGDVLLTDNVLFPGGFVIGNLYESQRLAGNVARRAAQNVNDINGYTLFIMLAPDIEEFDYSVDPGAAAFFCEENDT